MFGRRIHLFRILGFSIGIDPSWFIVVGLVTWTLAEGVFAPGGLMADWMHLGRLGVLARWTMGLAGALGLFASIVAHELAHALVARRYGIQMRGITLFIFGGVAEMTDEPPHPEAELMVAIAGPVASMIIGVLSMVLARVIGLRPVSAVLLHLGFANLMLVAFNVLPAFPLDGGRVLRSLLWAWKGNLVWATRVTSRLGSWFGAGFIALAVLFAVTGNLVSGGWWFLLGMFLRQASSMSYRQLLVRHALEGEPLRRFVQEQPVTVPPETTLKELVVDYVYRHGFRMYPVVADGQLLGCVTTRQVRAVPRDRWGATRVRDVAHRGSDRNSIRSDATALDALAAMSQSGSPALMVVEGGRLAGVVSIGDLQRHISLKAELEG